MKNARDLSEGLPARSVNRWMTGLVSSAPRAHVDYVSARWGKMPDDPGRITRDGRKLSKRGARHPVPGEEWIALTDAMIALLRAEFAAPA